MVTQQDISQVRSFNRLVTSQVGALNDATSVVVRSARRASCSRSGPDGATPRDVRARLGLDSGYLSRMLGALERDGLIERTPNPADRRSERLRLTRRGMTEVRELDRLSDELAARCWRPSMTGSGRGCWAAQAEVRRLLAISMVRIDLEVPSSADARWCLVALLRRAGCALRGALRSGQDVGRRADGPDSRRRARS